MVPDALGVALVPAYLLLLALIAVQYRRGKTSSTRAMLLAGVSLTWLSYGLLQVTQDGLVPTGTVLNYALDGLAVLLLVAGLAAMYRGWRGESETATSG